MPNLSDELQAYLGDTYSALSDEDKHVLESAYKLRRKSYAIYMFWFFSLHYAYIGKWKVFWIFFLTLGAAFCWWVIDLFRLPTILEEYNKGLAQYLVTKIGK